MIVGVSQKADLVPGMTPVRLLEIALLEYAERYGLTDKARTALSLDPRAELDWQPHTLGAAGQDSTF